MKKLLIFSHACATAANQQLYVEVAKITGWKIALVVPSNWRDEYGQSCNNNRWSEFDGELIPIPVWHSGNIILHRYRTALAKLITGINPDVIYVNHEPYAVATAQVYWGNFRTLQRPIGFYSCQNIFKRYPMPFRLTEAWVLRSSAFFFPISHAVDAVFRRKGYCNISTILPLAIDRTTYQRRDDAVNTRRELLGDNDPGVLIGYVGRFVPEKGLRTLFTALCRLVDLPWRLVMVGAGEMEKELRSRAADEGIADRVVFTGFVPHLKTASLFSAMDFLVLPSETQTNWREQFGRVLLEAMACGTPVIGSDSGEIPAIIRATNGGMVFRERDPVSLAATMRRMILDPVLRATLARAGASAVNELFSLPQAAKSFAETIEKVDAASPMERQLCNAW